MGRTMKAFVWSAIFQVGTATGISAISSPAFANDANQLAQEDVIGSDTVEPIKKKNKKKKKKKDKDGDTDNFAAKKDEAEAEAAKPVEANPKDEAKSKNDASSKQESRKKVEEKKKAEEQPADSILERKGNPVAALSLGFSNVLTRSLLVFLDSDEAAQANSFGFGFSLYLPPSAAVAYLNAIGLFVEGESFANVKKSIFYQSDSAPDQLKISGSDLAGGIVVRAPALVQGVLDGVGIKLGYQSFSERMTFTSATGRSDAEYEYKVAGPVLTLLLDVMPVKNIMIGTSVAPPISQSMTVETKSDSLNEEVSGSWAATRLKLYAGFKYVATAGLMMEGVGGVHYRADKIDSKQASISGVRNTSSVTPFGLFSLGFVLSP